MKSQEIYASIWTEPLPRTPMRKPTWRRGHDGDTAIKVPMPEEPPARTVSVLAGGTNGDRTTTLKRRYFETFDATAAQDAALAKCRLGYDHDLPQYPGFDTIKRRDSMQDDSSSTSGGSQTKDPVDAVISSPPAAPAELKQLPPAILPSTEPSTHEKTSTIPRELAIDGNAGFDPHHAGNEASDTIKTYRYKGQRYEVLGDEPEEWLKDVREVPRNPNRASKTASTLRQQSRGSGTPNSTLSATAAAGQTRRTSRRAASNNLEQDDRRRSGRPRRSAVVSQQLSQDDMVDFDE